MNKRLLAILLVVAVLTGVLAMGAFAEEQKDPIRIFTIGNSHANDSTWQLARVFAAQDPDREVIVGTMYYSGCPIDRHVRYAYSNAKEYTYHKNVNGVWTSTKNCDLATALADEPWDIVVLQEMNIQHGQEASFQNDNINLLIDFVKSKLDNEPQFYWNMVWANPIDPTFWEPGFDPQPPNYADLPGNSWIPRYEEYFGTDQVYMYEQMISNLKKYVLTNEQIDGVFTAGTAIQYANHMLGQTDIDLYRDYTHVSDLGRLIVAYLWYAELTGEPIDQVLVDMVPAAERCTWRQEALGDFNVTAEMKQVIKDAVNYTLEHPLEVPQAPADAIRCDNCRYEPEWTAWDGTTVPTAGGHYYLTKDVTLDQQITLPAGDYTVVLNLNGKTLTSTTRAFQVGAGATLAIMDGVGTGKIQAAGVAGENGGVGLVDAGGKLVIHGGLFTNTETTNGIDTGGVFYVNGNLTVRGGVITGGKVTRAAENVYISYTGSLTMADGRIEGGTNNDVFLRGSATLSRWAYIGDMCVSPHTSGPALGDMVTISGDFTKGHVGLEIMGTFTEGLDVGNGTGAVFGEENVHLVDTDENYGIISKTHTNGAIPLSDLKLTEKRHCGHCEKDAVWTPIDESWQTNKVLDGGHYYLAFNSDSYVMTERTVTAGHSVCLDLNGKGYTGTYRAFTVAEGATLTLLGKGWISGRGTDAGADGGVIYVAEDATLNLYEATVRSDIGTSNTRYAEKGGVLGIDGVFNMYGGKIRGDSLSTKEPVAWPTLGGVAYVGPTGMMNLISGTVNSGKLAEGGTGASIYSNGLICLSGDAKIDEIQIVPDTANNGPALGDMLEVGGEFTGSAVLNVADPKSGMDVGNLIGGGNPFTNITVKNSELIAKAEGEDLILYKVIICDHCGQEVEWTAWDGSALPANGGHYYLASDVQTGVAQVLSAGSYAIDLRGHTLTNSTRAFQVNSGASLSVMDSVGGGEIEAAGVAGETGGAIRVASGGSFELFSGNLTLIAENNAPSIGGVIHNSGTVTIWGGKIYGGAATTADNVYSGYGATLNIYGGVINGPDCFNTVYARGTVNLSGAPRVSPGIRLVPHSSGPKLEKMVTVSGAFTGDVPISAEDIAKNVDIGTVASGATIAEGSLCVYDNDNLELVAAGGELMVAGYSYCQHCQKTVLWTPIKDSSYWQTLKTLEGGHYSLAFSGGTYPLTEKSIPAGATVCIDLNGKYYQGTYRSFAVKANATLSIMDTVGGGLLAGRGTKAFNDGAAITVEENATLNLYSGTLGTQIGIVTDRHAANGGVLGIAGTFNMYGGSVNAVSDYDEASTYPTLGGAVYVAPTGVMNLYAGSINSGRINASGSGESIYVSGKLNLSGDAAADEVELAPVTGGPALAEMLNITGTYTGSITLALPDPVSGVTVGTATDCTLANECLTVNDVDGLAVYNMNGLLVAWDGSAPFVVSGPSGFAGGFDDPNAAVAACGEDQAIILMTEVDMPLALTKDLTVDLNGSNLITETTGAYTLYIKDSFTDDYDITEDSYGRTYGVLSATGSAKVAAAPGYVKITDGEEVSFHKVGLDIKSMSLRPEEAGLYFNCDFLGDPMVAQHVDSFGVALSVTGDPDETTLENPKHFTRFEKEAFGTENTSTLLTGILKDTSGYNTNQQRARIQVYGRAYIEVDGAVVFGDTKARSLREQLEGIDGKWEQLSNSQKRGVLDLYGQYGRIMDKWTMPNFQAEQAEEEDVLRVLVIGNSYSYDSTNLLYEVYESQNPEKEVQIGVMYHSGCTVAQHLGYIKSNAAQYDYKRTDENGNWVTDTSVVMDRGLLDQQWDIIVLQAGSAQANQADRYTDGTIGQLQEYVRSKLAVEPKFYWNMTWSYPQDTTFQNADFDPKAPDGWANTLFEASQGSRMTQYTGIADCVSQYIATDESFDKVLPSGTVVQYASNKLGLTDLQLHRDWTHLSDLGRLFVAHLWYAELEGLDTLDEVDFDMIPVALRATYRQQAEGDFLVTEEMQAGIREAVNWALENPYTVPGSPS